MCVCDIRVMYVGLPRICRCLRVCMGEREKEREEKRTKECVHSWGNLGLIQRKRETESESERERTRERERERETVCTLVSQEREREKEREREREREKGETERERERKKDRVHSWVTWVSVTELPRTFASSRKTFCSS